MRKVGESIKAARRKLGLAQRPFAQRAGLGQNLVVRAEKNEDVRLSTLEKLAQAGELELMLVPRELAPAVRSLMIAYEKGESIDNALEQPMYALDDEEADR